MIVAGDIRIVGNVMLVEEGMKSMKIRLGEFQIPTIGDVYKSDPFVESSELLPFHL
jgi:hypothetical protein